MNSVSKEYIIDKNYIYKNPFEELKNLLKENEKIKLVTLPKYVPIAFQVAKELNDEGIATYDEELKVERYIKDKKLKTKIYLSIKRKPKIIEYLIGNDYFFKNNFEEVKCYLKNHDKVTIVAKREEVGIAFKIAKELVSKGIALYDEELKLGRDYKSGKGSTKVYISLKKKPVIKEYLIKKEDESFKMYNDIKKLFEKKENVTISAYPLDVPKAFKIAKKLIDEGIASYDEELKIEPNFKAGKGKTKTFISLKRKTALKNNNNINIINKEKNSNEKESLKKDINLRDKKENILGKTKEEILEESHDKKDSKICLLKENVKEYEIRKNISYEKIIKDIKELLKENNHINLIARMNLVGATFNIVHILNKEGIITFGDELKIKRNFKSRQERTKIFISIKKKQI